MAESGRSPRLARNAVLAGLAVLGTTAAVTVTAVRPGAGEQACPGGEDWVIAQPLGLAMAGYGAGGAPYAPTLPEAATLPDAAGPPRPGTLPGTGSLPGNGTLPGAEAGGVSPLVLAGCVDTDLLHPMPVTGDGRG
jgi:hypothetical protein